MEKTCKRPFPSCSPRNRQRTKKNPRVARQRKKETNSFQKTEGRRKNCEVASQQKKPAAKKAQLQKSARGKKSREAVPAVPRGRKW